jgi:hypothetical protein
MGSGFFKSNSPKIGVAGQGLEARTLGSSAYQGRAAASGAQKGLTQAMALNKSKFKPQKTDGAYPKGPKL